MSDLPRRAFDIPSLDGLRALSIAIVFVSHAGYPVVPGGLGVSIFFVISGFLITSLLRAEAASTGRISLVAFYVRRFFRILPLFYLVLTLGLVAVALGVFSDGALDGGVSLDATASQLLHYFNYFFIVNDGSSIVPGTGVYWSLAIEEHFYVVFPVAVVGMRAAQWTLRTQAAVLLSACLVVLVWRIVLVFGMNVSNLRTGLATDTRLDGLLFGCAAALVGSPVLDRQANRRPFGATWQVCVAGFLLLLATLAWRDESFRETFRYTLQSISILACMRYLIAADGSWVFRLFNWRPVAWFGTLSYAFYLVHQIVIYAVGQWVSIRLMVLVLSFVVATTLSWLLHVAVERPVGRLRSRALRRLGR